MSNLLSRGGVGDVRTADAPGTTAAHTLPAEQVAADLPHSQPPAPVQAALTEREKGCDTPVGLRSQRGVAGQIATGPRRPESHLESMDPVRPRSVSAAPVLAALLRARLAWERSQPQTFLELED